MTQDLRCKGVTAQGNPCGATGNLIDPLSGLCPSHSPGAAERLAEAGRKGAEATARRFRGGGLPARELGPLKSISDAQRWLRTIIAAVGARQLSHGEGQAMTAGVREWLKAEDSRLRAEDLRSLQQQIAELKADKQMRVVR